LTLSDPIADAIERYVAARPKGGYGEHNYNFTDHGLDEAQERAKFRPYMIRFGVATEATADRTTTAASTALRPAGARTLLP
jgi:hypothetical protein